MPYLIWFIIASTSVFTPAERIVPPQVRVEAGSTEFVWECPTIHEIESLPDNLTGYTAYGCGYSGIDGSILLPQANMILAVPHGVEPVLEIIPEGVHFLSAGTVAGTSVSPDGFDSFFSAHPEDIPRTWGSLTHTGSFRRAGVTLLELHPIVFRDGALYIAERFRIIISYPDTGPPEAISGISGSIFNVLLEGGNRVWADSENRSGPSPFWGLPWYSLDTDTAGIYCITAAEIPSAIGVPSTTLSMFCGSGREMGNNPWETAYRPIDVPILVEDGGDGVFDSGDRLFFFGRGLAWWESTADSMPPHFNHRYSHINTYWLTWGGEDGARMDMIDGSLTGAPSIPDAFLSRQHLEENTIRAAAEVAFLPDDWAWVRSTGSTNTWDYFSFNAPATTGEGFLRLHLISKDYLDHRIRLTMNGSQFCDTTWSNVDDFILQVRCSDLRSSGNNLGIQIIRDSGEETIFFDWFEVFSWTEPSLSGQVQIPLDWWQVPGRQKFTWNNDLSNSYVFMIGGDDLAAFVTVDDPHSFEYEVPDYWISRELWISEIEDMLSPVSIHEESPGRIINVMSGADKIYIAADEFFTDILPLQQTGEQVQIIAASEVYNEFNGGVRDPQAIRAMIYTVIDTWNPIPMDLILVGGGNWDPLHFTSARVSYIDILRREPSETVTDDQFVIVGDSILPQIAVSRMGITNRSDLQLIVDRTLSYGNAENQGEWQTVVLGAADDERSPLHGGDERFHTNSMELLLTDHLPSVLRPEKMYMIFYDWNDFWKKPQAREDYISLWSKGSLVSLYLGHGGYDQLADEGLLYLEDVGLLACEKRLPVALFGSCDVGAFQNPASECIAQQITTSHSGGAIIASGSTGQTSGPGNEILLGEIIDRLFTEASLSADLSVGMCFMLGKIAAGYNSNNASNVLFGDGSLRLAYPWTSFDVNADTLFTGETAILNGSAPNDGIILIESFESCQPDTYYTFRDHDPIEYLSLAKSFFRGAAVASPDYSASMFVPIDSDTGSLARTQLVFLSDYSMAAVSTYPARMETGNPLFDTTGPEIELWIKGYRDVDEPHVSGSITVHALLSDDSGINLLGNTGRQLALYTDGTPQDVSGYFRYHQGSGTTGELEVEIGSLEQGDHQIQLRASDGLLNTSLVQMDFVVTSTGEFSINNVFPYPNPCGDGVSLNWTQTSAGTVDISIFTLAGRRIIEIGNIEGDAGYNQCWWDCRDADGDFVASGSYIFLVSCTSTANAGEFSEVTGVIAVVRESR